jgi:hypothetical protein
MKKTSCYLSFLILMCCANNYGQLKFVANLSYALKEVSGNEMVANSNLIWMLNDSGNSPEILE